MWKLQIIRGFYSIFHVLTLMNAFSSNLSAVLSLNRVNNSRYCNFNTLLPSMLMQCLLCLVVATVLYLDLDFIFELLKLPKQLPSHWVSNSEHHLQPCPPSSSSSHPHAKVVFWLELHVSLKETGTNMRIAKIAAANQIKTTRVMRKQGQGRGWQGSWDKADAGS